MEERKGEEQQQPKAAEYVATRQLQKGKELGEEIAAGVVNREENSGEK